MSAPLEDLQRGAVCIALYPFTPSPPLEVVLREADAAGDLNAKIEAHETVDAIARLAQKELVVEYKLRPVLLLQTGTSDQRQDVLAARINSITDNHRRLRSNWVRKLESGTHPLMLRLGHDARHGLRAESYVNLLSIQPVNKAAVLRRVGHLSDEEMIDVSERLVRSLEIDISRYVERLRPADARGRA